MTVSESAQALSVSPALFIRSVLAQSVTRSCHYTTYSAGIYFPFFVL